MNDNLKTERAKRKLNQKREHFVYFIGCQSAIKIGVARDVNQRMHQLQTGAFDKLELYGCVGPYTFDDVFKVETILQEDVAYSRTHGEWFYKKDVLALIERIKNGNFPEKLNRYGEVMFHSSIPSHIDFSVEISVLDNEQTAIRKSICRKLDLIDDVKVLQWIENTLNMIIKIGD